MNYALQEVLNAGFRFPDPAPAFHQDQLPDRPRRPVPPTTTAPPGWWATPPAWPRRPGSATPWVTSSVPGRNLTVNGKFYQGIDGYMIAGPMFSNYMAQVAPAYGTNPFTAPPTNMVNGAPATRQPTAGHDGPRAAAGQPAVHRRRQPGKQRQEGLAHRWQSALSWPAASGTSGAALPSPPRAGAAAGLAAVGYGLWEKNQFVLREETLPILPAGQQPFRILHLSDIHFVPGPGHRRRRGCSRWRRWSRTWWSTPATTSATSRPLTRCWRRCAPLLEFPGVFVPGSNDYFATQLQEPGVLPAGPVQGQAEAGRTGLAAAAFRLRHGRLGGPDQPQPVRGAERHALRLLRRGRSAPEPGTLRRLAPRHQGPGRERRTSGWPSSTPPTSGSWTTSPRTARTCCWPATPTAASSASPATGPWWPTATSPRGGPRASTTGKATDRTTPVNVSGGIGTSRFAPVRIACKPEAVLLTLTARG